MKLDKLRAAMAENRMTQEELAKQMNLATKTVNAKLNGKVSITVEEASLMSKVLKLKDPAYIFFD